MIISSTTDYRAAAQKRLPPFLFHYLDGGAYAEKTLAQATSEAESIVALARSEVQAMQARAAQALQGQIALREQQALLRVHLLGLAGRDPEVVGVEAPDVVEEAAPLGRHSPGRKLVRVVIFVGLPAVGVSRWLWWWITPVVLNAALYPR